MAPLLLGREKQLVDEICLQEFFSFTLKPQQRCQFLLHSDAKKIGFSSQE